MVAHKCFSCKEFNGLTDSLTSLFTTAWDMSYTGPKVFSDQLPEYVFFLRDC